METGRLPQPRWWHYWPYYTWRSRPSSPLQRSKRVLETKRKYLLYKNSVKKCSSTEEIHLDWFGGTKAQIWLKIGRSSLKWLWSGRAAPYQLSVITIKKVKCQSSGARHRVLISYRLVRSLKRMLYTIRCSRCLSDVVLHTNFCAVEHTPNFFPITTVSVRFECYQALPLLGEISYGFVSCW